MSRVLAEVERNIKNAAEENNRKNNFFDFGGNDCTQIVIMLYLVHKFESIFLRGG